MLVKEMAIKEKINESVILYISPHQDDELLTMGVDICNEFERNESNLHICLLTDGSKSSIKKVLSNGRRCKWHFGKHKYHLSFEQFVKARDVEFMSSCRSLGFQMHQVHILQNRAIDGELTVETAKKYIKQIISEFPQNVIVCTISPFGADEQHSDHRNLGQAAIDLFNEGDINELRLFVEPYCYVSSRKSYPNLELSTIYPSAKGKKVLKKAAKQYALWKPRKERFAIGYHSVSKMFNSFLMEPVGFFHSMKKGNE